MSRSPAAYPRNRLTRFSGVVDIVGVVRYQCPSSMPPTVIPETAAVESSVSQVRLPLSVMNPSPGTLPRITVNVDTAAMAKANRVPAARRSSVHMTDPRNDNTASVTEIQRTISPPNTGSTPVAVDVGPMAMAASTDSPSVTSIWIRKKPDVTSDRGMMHHTRLKPQIR